MKLTIRPGKKDKIHILIDGDYKTTVDAVLAENDLSEETIREKRLLIIPTA